VRFLLAASGGVSELSPRVRIASIGPVTSATLREHGLRADVEADRHDVDGLVAALVGDAAARA
jgi:uroporphyrinogen III methyltransferase/synthase